MKTRNHKVIAERAFTLPELMITTTLTVMLLGGVIMGHVVGLRMFQYTKAKLGNDDEARSAMSHIVDEIRTAKLIRVGNGDAARFTECVDNAPQQGNALQIHPTTASNLFVRYFLDSQNTFQRMTNGAPDAEEIAHNVTNRIVFTSEGIDGLTLTNHDNNRVIGVNLQFYQLQMPQTKAATNRHFEFFQLRTKVTRRAD